MKSEPLIYVAISKQRHDLGAYHTQNFFSKNPPRIWVAGNGTSHAFVSRFISKHSFLWGSNVLEVFTSKPPPQKKRKKKNVNEKTFIV